MILTNSTVCIRYGKKSIILPQELHSLKYMLRKGQRYIKCILRGYECILKRLEEK